MRKSNRGFSLPESLIAMAIVSIGAALGLPAFQGALERQRTNAALNLVAATFAHARNAAITHGMPVSVCPSQGRGPGHDSWDWRPGRMLNRERRQPPPQPGDILRSTNSPFHRSIRLVSSSGRRYVRFLPDGRSSGSNITVHVCGNGRLRGEVIVNNWGRIRMTRTPGTQACPST